MVSVEASEAGPQAQERPVVGLACFWSRTDTLRYPHTRTAPKASPQHRNRTVRNLGLPSKSLEPQKAGAMLSNVRHADAEQANEDGDGCTEAHLATVRR